MHVTTPIEDKKLELQKALIDGFSVILVPRPGQNSRTSTLCRPRLPPIFERMALRRRRSVFMSLRPITTENETSFEGTVRELEGKEFSDLSVMVFNQTSLDSYMNYRWQWED